MNKASYIPILILFILLFFPLISLFSPGLPVTHDGQDHVARIANFYASLSEGNSIPRWGANLNWGFGHPVMMFLYPLPSYVSSFFHFLGFSLVDSTKLFFGVAYILSGITMYLWAKKEWGTIPGLISSLVYTFAPYRFVDLYVRGAIGEHAAFIFLPLVLLGMYEIYSNSKSSISFLLLSFSIFGLLLSHNAISIMMVPLILIYAVYLYAFRVKEKRQFIIGVVLGLLLGIGMSSFFIIPAFFEGKYTLRDIVTKGEVVGRMVPIEKFIYSPWNYGGGADFTKQIGLAGWFFVILSSIFFVKSKDTKTRAYIGFFLLLFFIILWLMTSSSIFVWNNISVLQKFQFPWRFLTLSVLLTSILSGVSSSLINKKYHNLLVGIVVFVVLFSTFNMWKPVSYKIYEESFFTNVYKGTTDTGESSPIWSVRFMEYSPIDPIQVGEGNASIDIGKRTTTTREYRVNAFQTTKLIENTLYFPGWVVKVDGKEVQTEFQNPIWRGRMSFIVEPGLHTVDIIFQRTKLRRLSDLVSIITILIFILLLTFCLLKKIKTYKI